MDPRHAMARDAGAFLVSLFVIIVVVIEFVMGRSDLGPLPFSRGLVGGGMPDGLDVLEISCLPRVGSICTAVPRILSILREILGPLVDNFALPMLAHRLWFAVS